MDESLMADAGGLGGRALPSCHSTPAGVITRGEYEAQWVRSSDASQSVSEIAASGLPPNGGGIPCPYPRVPACRHVVPLSQTTHLLFVIALPPHFL